MFPVGDNPSSLVGIPNLLDVEGSEEYLVKWPSTFNSRIYED